MEKDIDRISKSQDTDIVIRIDDFGGKKGVTIREFVKSERYSGFTKNGTRIPADKFHLFKKAINAIDEKDLEGPVESQPIKYTPKQSTFDNKEKPAYKKTESSKAEKKVEKSEDEDEEEESEEGAW